MKKLTDNEKKLFYMGYKIEENDPIGDELAFFHSIMCQVGLPRSKQTSLDFERTCGNAAIYLRAGKIWDGETFVQQELPYGAMPRLILSWLNTTALKNKTKEIDLGDSMSAFMSYLGLEVKGGKRGTILTFKKQIKSLAACNITLGYTINNIATTYDGKPIQQFDAWLNEKNETQKSLWNGKITLSDEYYNTLKQRAVPIDVRALLALKKSSLAMDIYAMFADRLHRIGTRPVILHWKNLKIQFGQEYNGKEADKDFKKEYLDALKKVLVVYPRAKVTKVNTGIMLMASPPPVPYKKIYPS